MYATAATTTAVPSSARLTQGGCQSERAGSQALLGGGAGSVHGLLVSSVVAARRTLAPNVPTEGRPRNNRPDGAFPDDDGRARAAAAAPGLATRRARTRCASPTGAIVQAADIFVPVVPSRGGGACASESISPPYLLNEQRDP